MRATAAAPVGMHANADAAGIVTTEEPAASVHVPVAQAVVVTPGSGVYPAAHVTLIAVVPADSARSGDACCPTGRPRGEQTGYVPVSVAVAASQASVVGIPQKPGWQRAV